MYVYQKMPLPQLRLTVMNRREVWKLEIGLNVGDRVRVSNEDRSHGQEFRGEKARRLIQHFGLSKWVKPKTYVYGRFLPETKKIEFEGNGELCPLEHPDW